MVLPARRTASCSDIFSLSGYRQRFGEVGNRGRDEGDEVNENSFSGASWVNELSHAAYLGKGLVRAELTFKYGFKYVQDGA